MAIRKGKAASRLRIALGLGLGLLALAAGSPRPASAQSACETETAALQAFARGVKIDIAAPADLRAGGTIKVSWQSASRFPPKTPAFLAVAIPGEVRV